MTSATPTYTAAHMRVTRARGSASGHLCRLCREPAAEWAYVHGSLLELRDERGRPYSPSPDDYVPLCMPCHRAYDRDAYRRRRPTTLDALGRLAKHVRSVEWRRARAVS